MSVDRWLLYLGEGERDVGRESAGRRIGRPFEGDLPRLVRRCAELLGLETRFGYRADTFGNIVRQLAPRRGRPTRTGGKSKELRDAVVFSLRQRSTLAIVALIDAREDEFNDLRADAADVAAQCGEERAEVPVAIGLALHEIETWLLADVVARRAAFGDAVGGADLPAALLERIRDPKQLWASLAGRCSRPQGLSKELHLDGQRQHAWAAMRPAIVASACPDGFAPFHEAACAVLRAVLSKPTPT